MMSKIIFASVVVLAKSSSNASDLLQDLLANPTSGNAGPPSASDSLQDLLANPTSGNASYNPHYYHAPNLVSAEERNDGHTNNGQASEAVYADLTVVDGPSFGDAGYDGLQGGGDAQEASSVESELSYSTSVESTPSYSASDADRSCNDYNGLMHSWLSDEGKNGTEACRFKGCKVVLDWANPACLEDYDPCPTGFYDNQRSECETCNNFSWGCTECDASRCTSCNGDEPHPDRGCAA